jgi:ABC-type glycerol-3-phosphate transport system permease component
MGTLTAVIIAAVLCAVMASYAMLWVSRKSGLANTVTGVIIVFVAIVCAVAIAYYLTLYR